MHHAERAPWRTARARRLTRLCDCMVAACPLGASRRDDHRANRRRDRARPAGRRDRCRAGRGGARAPTAARARRPVVQHRPRRRGTSGSCPPCHRRGPGGSSWRLRPAPRRGRGGGRTRVRQSARPALVLPRSARRCPRGGAGELRPPRRRPRRACAGRVRVGQSDGSAPRRERLVRLVRRRVRASPRRAAATSSNASTT